MSLNLRVYQHENRPLPVAGLVSGAWGPKSAAGLSPAAAGPVAVWQHLQRQVGNRAVRRLLRRPVLRAAASLLMRVSVPAREGDPPESMRESNNLVSDYLAGNDRLERCLDGSRSHYLRRGDRGEDVLRVQRLLIALGLLPGSAPSGRYDSDTYRAVKRFQAGSGMSGADVDGVVGRKTIALLDRAGRQGRVESDADQTAGDFLVTGKFTGAAERPGSIYFERASADLSGDRAARDKAGTFAREHRGERVTLVGHASEEGPASANRALIDRRLQAVVDLIKAAWGLPAGGRDPANLVRERALAASAGHIDYRAWRKVDMLAGRRPQTGQGCPPGSGQPGTCGREQTGALRQAAGKASELIGTAQSRLPPSGAMIGVFDALFRTTASNRSVIAGRLKTIAGAVRAHIGSLPSPGRHFCANMCHHGCAAGWTAWNTDRRELARTEQEKRNPPGVFNFCPAFFEDYTDVVNRALVLVHEGHHGTPGIHSLDYAYNTERLIFMLDTETALKNASSFHLFVMRFSGIRPGGSNGPRVALYGPQVRDQFGAGLRRDPRRLEKLRQAVAWIEHWVKFADNHVSSAYNATKRARHGRRWNRDTGYWPGEGDRNYHGTYLMRTHLAPRFRLTRPPHRPGAADQAALAAIFDRIRRMGAAFNQGLSFRSATRGGTVWTPGPGSQVKVAAGFFRLRPSQQTTLLLRELVHATPGISARLEAEYVAFIEVVSRERGWSGPRR